MENFVVQTVETEVSVVTVCAYGKKSVLAVISFSAESVLFYTQQC
jgi:hypothetical protein